MKKHCLRRIFANLLAFGLLFNEVSTPFLVRAEGEEIQEIEEESTSEDEVSEDEISENEVSEDEVTEEGADAAEEDIIEEEEVVVSGSEEEEDPIVITEEPVGSGNYYDNDERNNCLNNDPNQEYYHYNDVPDAWGSKVVGKKDPTDKIEYNLYGNTSSGYKLLVCADPFSIQNDFGTEGKYRLTGYDMCITHDYLSEEFSSYKNNIVEIVFRGIEEIDDNHYSAGEDNWFGNMARLKRVYFDENFGYCGCDRESDYYYGWQHHYSCGACIGIKDGVFANNPELEEFLLPEYLREISDDLFYNCPKLKKVYCADGTNNPYPCVAAGKHINKDLTLIQRSAFEGCSSLTDVFFPRSLQRIESNAFKDCIKIKTVDLRGTALYYLDGAFNDCTSLESVYLPYDGDYYISKLENNPKTPGGTWISYSDYSDYYISKERDLTSAVEEHAALTLDGSFYGCTGLKKVYMGDAVTKINNYTFFACSALEDVVDLQYKGSQYPDEAYDYSQDEYDHDFPKSVRYIGSSAFSGCKNLWQNGSLYLYTTFIGDNAFSNAFSNHNYNGNGSVDVKIYGKCAIGEGSSPVYGVFENAGIKSIKLYDSCTINAYAFKDCNVIPDEIPAGSTIMTNAFYDNSASSISIGNNCIIEKDAFNSAKIPTITIGTGATIGDEAFRDNLNLSLVNMPASVTSLGKDIFKGCFKLLEKNKLNDMTNTVYVDANQADISGIEWLQPEAINTWMGIPVKSITLKDGYIIPSEWVYATDLSLETDSVTLKKGDFKYLSYSLSPGDTDSEIFWSSSDPSVVTVNSGQNRYDSTSHTYVDIVRYDNTAFLRAEDVGTAIITAKTSDGKITKTLAVTVSETGNGSVWVLNVIDDSGELNGDLSIPIGQTEQLKWIIEPETATNKNVRFESLDPQIMNISKTGLVTAVSPGTTKIRIISEEGGVYSERTYIGTGTSVRVSGVGFDKASDVVGIGKSKKLAYTITPENATVKNTFFESSDPAVLTISDDGTATGVKEGTATVTLLTMDGNFTDSCEVTVIKPVTGVSVSPKTLEMMPGESKTLTVTVTPADAGDKSYTFNSSDPSVATVSDDGVVVAQKTGTTTITVITGDETITDTCEVTVKAGAEVTGVTINPKTLNIKVGETATVSAAVLPENAGNRNVSFSSSDETVATVSQNGTVTAIKEGSAVITATTESGSFTDTCQVTVTKEGDPVGPDDPVDPQTEFYTVNFYNGSDLVGKETVSDGSLIVNVPVVIKNNAEFAGWWNKETSEFFNTDAPIYKNINLYARFKDLNGNIEPLPGEEDDLESYEDIYNKTESSDIYLVKSQKISVMGDSISSSDKSILSAGKSQNGITVLTAKKPGVTELILTNVSGNTIKHRVHVGTPAFDNKAIKIAPGETKSLNFSVGSDTDKYRVFYSSSNPDAVIIRDGGVYGLSKGSSVITAHVNGKKYTCKVTVSDPVSPKVIEEGADLTLAPLQTFNLKFSDKFNAKKASWEIENPAIVSIKKGKLTATGVGKTKVTGSFDGKSKSFTISVLAPKPQTLHINAGKSKTVKIYKLSNKKAVWSTSNNAVAEVNKGKIKGVSCGVAEITATYAGFTFRTFVVVEDPAVATDAKLSLNGKKYNLTLEYGDTYLLTTKGTSQQVVFTSNKPEIARVGKDGKVYCCGMGKAKLTAKVNGKTITVNVTVNSKSL